LARLVNSAGRIGLNLLQRMVQAVSSEDFIRFMQKPVLAGSAIHLGTLAAQSGNGSRELNRTSLFEPVGSGEDAVSASESLKLAIYPLIKGELRPPPARSFPSAASTATTSSCRITPSPRNTP